jgi:hypothetical protein
LKYLTGFSKGVYLNIPGIFLNLLLGKHILKINDEQNYPGIIFILICVSLLKFKNNNERMVQKLV